MGAAYAKTLLGGRLSTPCRRDRSHLHVYDHTMIHCIISYSSIWYHLIMYIVYHSILQHNIVY